MLICLLELDWWPLQRWRKLDLTLRSRIAEGGRYLLPNSDLVDESGRKHSRLSRRISHHYESLESPKKWPMDRSFFRAIYMRNLAGCEIRVRRAVQNVPMILVCHDSPSHISGRIILRMKVEFRISERYDVWGQDALFERTIWAPSPKLYMSATERIFSVFLNTATEWDYNHVSPWPTVKTAVARFESWKHDSWCQTWKSKREASRSGEWLYSPWKYPIFVYLPRELGCQLRT